MEITSTLVSSPALNQWNSLPAIGAAAAVLPCCGSHRWAATLASRRPFADESELLAASRHIWSSLPHSDWQEAFNSHPRIGERKAQGTNSAASLAWSRAEQSAAMAADEAAKAALRDANSRYEQRFGRIFIVCARGRSGTQILAELERRLGNTPQAELLEAAHEQAQITELRLMQWLGAS